MHPSDIQHDHTAFALKTALRHWVLERLAVSYPHILETHGGEGWLWHTCYQQTTGLVIEKDPARCHWLERQRPGTWEVCCGNSASLLFRGYAAQTAFDVLDVDPHTQPWPTLEAFFLPGRAYNDRMGVVVTDSLRQGVRYDGGRRIHGLKPWAVRYGRHVHRFYLQVCRERLEALAQPVGYRVTDWRGEYWGKIKTMTGYAAILQRTCAAAPASAGPCRRETAATSSMNRPLLS